MPDLIVDDRGFTCECGCRNEYPDYVRDHREVRLVFSCPCKRQYVLYRGSVQRVTQVLPDYQESEAFGD